MKINAFPAGPSGVPDISLPFARSRPAPGRENNHPAKAAADRLISGFTLIELLVVIAIIALLAGLLFPALSAAKEQGHRATCLNNIRQMQLAWTLYATDNRDGMVMNTLTVDVAGPSGSNIELGRSQVNPWVVGAVDYNDYNTDNTNVLTLIDPARAAFAPYIRTAATYKCPDDPSVVSVLNTRIPRVRSYALSADLGGIYEPGWGADLPCYTKLSQIGTPLPSDPNLPVVPPSDQFAFIDTNPDTLVGAPFCTANIPINWWEMPAHYHDNAANISFTDGHAQAQTWRDPEVLAPVTGIQFIGKIAPKGSAPDLQWFLRHSGRRVAAQ